MNDLSSLIQRGRVEKSIAVLVHAEHGEGKTYFGSHTPNPIIICGEEIDEVEQDKFPKCLKWDDFINQLGHVRDHDKTHETLVIDTLDSMEILLHKQILKEEDNGKATMATACGGFGKAYDEAAQRMLFVRDDFLVPIRNRGVNIVLLSHTMRYRIEDPILQLSYERFEPKLHSKRNGMGVRSVFTEWVSIIGWGSTEKVKVMDKNGKENLYSDGTRLLYCVQKPHIVAKNRYKLPESIPFEWESLDKKVKEFYKKNVNPEAESLKMEIAGLVGQIREESLKKSTAINVSNVGNDVARLEKAKAFIEGHLRSQKNEGEEL